MSNIVTHGGVIARTSSGNVVPIMLVPEGTVGTDETAAITAAINALPATGGAIMFEARQYLCNVVVVRDGVSFICQGGGGDGNVATGFAPYDNAKPALQLGDGTTQHRRFSMFGGRIYSQTQQFGLLVNGMADFCFFGTEIGGFTVYALRVTSGAGASSYYGDFIGCKFFAVSGMTAGTSRIIDLIYGAGFATTIRLIGGSVDGSALGGAADGTGPCAIAIGQTGGKGVDLWTVGTVFQLKHFKGVRVTGAAATAGRWHASGGIADSSDTAPAVILEIPSTELVPNSYLIGADFRLNGAFRNATPLTIDVRGNNQFGHGFLYSPRIYEPDVSGWLNLIPTFQQTGVRIQAGGGGTPEGSLAGTTGDVVISVNNAGSSNQIFVKTQNSISGDVTKGWQRLASGDYYHQKAPNPIVSAATTDILHAAGDTVDVTGTATITDLGSDAAIDSGRIRRVLAGGAFTYTHTGSPTNGQMYCLGQANLTVASGDLTTWLWQGNSFGWRMIDHQPSDMALFHPVGGWSAWTGTKSKTSLDTAAATLPQVAAALGQLIDDLKSRKVL